MFKKICFFLCFSAILAASVKPVIVFDYGEVVGNFDKKVFEDSVVESLGISPEEMKDLCNSLEKEVKEKEVPIKKFYDDYAKQHGWSVDLNEITDQAALKASYVYQDMQKVIHQLKHAGYRVAILSNVSEYSSKTIRKKGFYEPFDPVILSCDIKVKKPDPRAYLHLLTALQVPAEKCIFIDDKKGNVEAARALNIDGIHYHSVEELLQEFEKRGINLK